MENYSPLIIIIWINIVLFVFSGLGLKKKLWSVLFLTIRVVINQRCFLSFFFCCSCWPILGALFEKRLMVCRPILHIYIDSLRCPKTRCWDLQSTSPTKHKSHALLNNRGFNFTTPITTWRLTNYKPPPYKLVYLSPTSINSFYILFYRGCCYNGVGIHIYIYACWFVPVCAQF